MVGFIKEHKPLKYGEQLLSREGSCSLSSPKAMLLGRILRVVGEPLQLAMASPVKMDGVKVIDGLTLQLEDGATVEIGTGASPKGYDSERKVFVEGPCIIKHGEVIPNFREVNRPTRDLLKEFGEGMIVPKGQKFNTEDYPKLSAIYSTEKLPEIHEQCRINDARLDSLQHS